MKRALSLLLAAILSLSLFACAQTVQDPTGERVEIEPDMLGPLFRIKAVENQPEPLTKYYPTESGIAYVSKTEKGYMGGYFMLPDLISNEEIFTCVKEPSAVFDLGDEKAAVFADGKLILISLELGRANTFELYGKMNFTDIILGADGAFYYENEDYILTADLDFSEKYDDLSVTEKVVMPKDKIPGYVGLLAVSEDGQRLYYEYEENGVRSSAFFGIGYKAERLGATPLSYVKKTRFSGTDKLLLEGKAENGERTYTLLSLDGGDKKELKVGAGLKYAGVTVNAKGTHLVACQTDEDGLGGYLDLYSFETSKRLKHYELAELKINPNVVATLSAKYLVLGQFDNGTAYDDRGGETVTVIEVAY